MQNSYMIDLWLKSRQFFDDENEIVKKFKEGILQIQGFEQRYPSWEDIVNSMQNNNQLVQKKNIYKQMYRQILQKKQIHYQLQHFHQIQQKQKFQKKVKQLKHIQNQLQQLGRDFGFEYPDLQFKFQATYQLCLFKKAVQKSFIQFYVSQANILYMMQKDIQKMKSNERIKLFLEFFLYNEYTGQKIVELNLNQIVNSFRQIPMIQLKNKQKNIAHILQLVQDKSMYIKIKNTKGYGKDIQDIRMKNTYSQVLQNSKKIKRECRVVNFVKSEEQTLNLFLYLNEWMFKIFDIVTKIQKLKGKQPKIKILTKNYKQVKSGLIFSKPMEITQTKSRIMRTVYLKFMHSSIEITYIHNLENVWNRFLNITASVFKYVRQKYIPREINQNIIYMVQLQNNRTYFLLKLKKYIPFLFADHYITEAQELNGYNFIKFSRLHNKNSFPKLKVQRKQVNVLLEKKQLIDNLLINIKGKDYNDRFFKFIEQIKNPKS